MKLRVFTLRLDPATGVFDDGVLQAFLEHREALDVSEHFFVHERVPTLALLVRYREVARPACAPAREGPKPDPAAELSGEDRPLYDALRRWRNERAKRDGRPAYVLLTNRQVAEIARRRPGSQRALQEIEGVGEGKARDLGDELLAMVASQPPRVETEPEPVASDDEYPVRPTGRDGDDG